MNRSFLKIFLIFFALAAPAFAAENKNPPADRRSRLDAEAGETDDAFLEDLPQDRLLQGFPLLRGE